MGRDYSITMLTEEEADITVVFDWLLPVMVATKIRSIFNGSSVIR